MKTGYRLIVGPTLLGVVLFLTYWAGGEASGPSDEVQTLLALERSRVAVPAVSAAEDRPSVPASPANVVLDEQRQQKIWHLEHLTFELEWKFGKQVKDALRSKNSEKLLSCFLPESGGELPSWEDQLVTGHSWWRQYEIEDVDGAPRRQADSRDVVRFLMDAAAEFTEIKKVSLRVLKIDSDDEQSDRYRLSLLLTASGTDARGPASMTSNHQLVVQFANDQQIADGRIVQYWSVDSITHRGVNEDLFAEVTELYDLDQLDLPDNWRVAPGTGIDTYTCQMAVDDYDRDGFLDVAISSLQGRQYLLRSLEGRSFEDITRKVGLPTSRPASLTTMATWIDIDNDGFSDLLLGKTLYRNDRGERFSRIASNGGLRFDAATMGAVVVDYDCDGWLDLYVLNHLGDRAGKRIGFVDDDTLSGVKNQLWRNMGNGQFADVSDEAGIHGEARHSFAATWFHANEDRFPDLYLVNDFGRNCLFINRGDGTFDDITDQAGVGDFANSMGAAAGDLDNDGTAEIYVANMFSKMGRRIIAHVNTDDYPEGVFRGIEGACAGSHLYRRSGSTMEYDEISVQKSVNEIGWAYAPVMADFDADGLLDIYATSGFISVDRGKPDG